MFLVPKAKKLVLVITIFLLTIETNIEIEMTFSLLKKVK